MISVIIPNFNQQQHVADTIESVLAQRKVSEIIIVDDASSDGSTEIIQRYAKRDRRITFIPLEFNRNASYCRNRGLERATNPYVLFLDSDDLLAKHCSENRLEWAISHPGYDIWVFPMGVFRDSPETSLDAWVPRPGDHLTRFLAHSLDWAIMQPLWKREFLSGIGGFDESFRRLQDPELHVRALIAGARVQCVSREAPDCFYRAFRDSMGDATPLSHRNLTAALRFYENFFERVPSAKRNALTGTLLAAISQHAHWRRQGRLSGVAYAEATHSLCCACRLPRHQSILCAYARLQAWLPFHVPGLNRSTRKILGLPP